jgi:hypothetical protein
MWWLWVASTLGELILKSGTVAKGRQVIKKSK